LPRWKNLVNQVDGVYAHRFVGSEGGESHVVGFSVDVSPAPFKKFVRVYDDLYHAMTHYLGHCFIPLKDGLEPTRPTRIVGLEVWVN
jgi:hypothetical protein